MKKRKSTVFDSGELDGPIVSLPGNRKKGKTLEQYKDDTIGKIGTDERDLYEALNAKIKISVKLDDKEVELV